MTRSLVVLAAALVLCGAARGETPAERGPAIRVDPTGFDFGEVLPGKTLRKEFRLRNAGDQDLVLKPVRTSCGCTAGKLARTTLEPGAATTLTVTVTTSGSGHIVKSVLVPSNDPRTPLLEIKVQATVGVPATK